MVHGTVIGQASAHRSVMLLDFLVRCIIQPVQGITTPMQGSSEIATSKPLQRKRSEKFDRPADEP
jgi:hypothetical protein